jgi:membrane associated rhomboid family serine protease
MVGASGAIAGVMGAYLVKFPRTRILTLIMIIIFFTTIEVPAWLMLIYWFGLQFLSSVGSLGSYASSQGGTAFFAHVGGFIAGIILIRVMGPPRATYGYGYGDRYN